MIAPYLEVPRQRDHGTEQIEAKIEGEGGRDIEGGREGEW